jgi:hypothetical protein
MDHKERESKANLAPAREFIRRVFSNMEGLRRAGTRPRDKLGLIPVGATPGVERWPARRVSYALLYWRTGAPVHARSQYERIPERKAVNRLAFLEVHTQIGHHWCERSTQAGDVGALQSLACKKKANRSPATRRRFESPIIGPHCSNRTS